MELILKQRRSPRSQKLQEKFGINLTHLPRVLPPGVGNPNSVVNGPSQKIKTDRTKTLNLLFGGKVLRDKKMPSLF